MESLDLHVISINIVLWLALKRSSMQVLWRLTLRNQFVGPYREPIPGNLLHISSMNSHLLMISEYDHLSSSKSIYIFSKVSFTIFIYHQMNKENHLYADLVFVSSMFGWLITQSFVCVLVIGAWRSAGKGLKSFAQQIPSFPTSHFDNVHY